MQEIELQDFEYLVSEAIDTLSSEMLSELDNVIFVVEDRPEDGSDILGLYDGFSLAERSSYGYGEEPDRIVLFREPLLKTCQTHDDLTREIRATLIHEIAHFYGLSEERIHELGWG